MPAARWRWRERYGAAGERLLQDAHVPFRLPGARWVQALAWIAWNRSARADAQAEGDAVKGFDGGGIFAQLDLGQVAEGDVGALGHLGEGQAEGFVALADGGADVLAQGFLGEAEEAPALQGVRTPALFSSST